MERVRHGEEAEEEELFEDKEERDKVHEEDEEAGERRVASACQVLDHIHLHHLKCRSPPLLCHFSLILQSNTSFTKGRRKGNYS